MLTNTAVARVCHEANRAYCLSHGDFSHKPWDETPAEIQNSVIDGVALKRDRPDLTPQESHENWLEYKRKEGWSYGPVKDLERKEHPCFLPYWQLPVEDRRKDALFCAIVKALSED